MTPDDLRARDAFLNACEGAYAPDLMLMSISTAIAFARNAEPRRFDGLSDQQVVDELAKSPNVAFDDEGGVWFSASGWPSPAEPTANSR